MKTLFTATLAVVLLLFIGWSIFSDSKEPNDSEQVHQVTAENYSPDFKMSKIHATPNPDNHVTAPADLQEEESNIPANNSPVSATDNTITETDNEMIAANRSTDKSVNQSFGKRLPERKAQSNPGDMPNEKFVKEIEKHQTVSYHNYDEILRLAK